MRLPAHALILGAALLLTCSGMLSAAARLQDAHPGLWGALADANHGRSLQATTDSSLSTTGNNCSCSQDAASEEHLLQLVSYCGAMPVMQHYTFVFQQLRKARGLPVLITNVVQDFDSPDHLTSLAQQYPSYDYAAIENRGLSGILAIQGGKVAKDMFQPPAWLSNYTTLGPEPDSAALQGALDGLLYQAADLIVSRPVMLVYRKDVLDAQGLSVPRTWDELLAAASKVNGTDMNGDNVTDHALCVDVDPECKLYWTFSSLAASILQANGTSSGYLLDPDTGEYLMRSEGMMVALRMWSQLMKYNSPEQATKAYCGVWEDAFAQGRCAFTLNMQQIDSCNRGTSNLTAQHYSWGRSGHAPAPGSTVVYDRAARGMVECSPANCPHAVPMTLTPSGGGPAEVRWVNRAPVTSRNANTEQDLRSAKPASVALRVFSESWNIATRAWLFLAFAPAFFSVESNRRNLAGNGLNVTGWDWASADMMYYNSSAFVVDAYQWVESLRAQTEWPPAGGVPQPSTLNSVPWLGPAEYLGLSPDEAAEHLRLAMWSHTHPNAVPDPQMVAPLRITVASAAHQKLQGVNESLIVSDMDYKLGLWALVPPTSWTKEGYYQDIGYVHSMPHPRYLNSTLPAPPSSRLTPGQLAAAVTSPVVVAIVVLGVVGVVFVRSRKRAGYDLFGKVRPPSLGPSTSLLVTDIQNSTLLWEALSPLVMERAVQLHHALLRDRLQDFRGYETCTEGDSFIIAFHTPHDALRYCLAVQVELLSAPWPQALLEDAVAADDAGCVTLQYSAGAMAWCEGRSMALRTTSSGNAKPGPWRLSWPWSKSSPSLSYCDTSIRGGLSQYLEQLPSSSNETTEQRGKNNRQSRHSMQTSGGPSSKQLLPGNSDPQISMSNGDSSTSFRFLTLGTASAVSPSQRLQGGQLLGRTASSPASPNPPPTPSSPDEEGSGVAITVLGSEENQDGSTKFPTPLHHIPEAGLRHSATHSGEMHARQWTPGHSLQSWLRQQVWALPTTQDGSEPTAVSGAAMSFCGLRVRMGLHAGLTEPHSWSVNQTTGRWCASGHFLATAKAVGDAGAGGMILLSGDFWNALQPFGVPSECVVLHMGQHQSQDQQGAMALYLALPTPLASRLAVFPPLRTLKLVSPSILEAPVGQAVVVFMHAVGIKALHSWDEEVTKDTLQIYHETVSQGLLEWDGYLVELADGLCLASFTDPSAAVCWALSTQADLLEQDWNPRLLQHELCEEVAVTLPGQRWSPHATASGPWPTPTPAAIPDPEAPDEITRRHSDAGCIEPALLSSMPNIDRKASFQLLDGNVRKKVLLRGLRIKAGIDLGDVRCRVNPATGRMAYMGKVMNRAARISNVATSSQVLCSMQAWNASCLSSNTRNNQLGNGSCSLLPALHGIPPVLGTSLGPRGLKGISEKVHLVHCTLDDM